MRYPVVLEHDPETGHYTATVPGLPSIVVDAKSERVALRRVREAIGMALREGRKASPRGRPRRGLPLRAKIVSVNV